MAGISKTFYKFHLSLAWDPKLAYSELSDYMIFQAVGYFKWY